MTMKTAYIFRLSRVSRNACTYIHFRDLFKVYIRLNCNSNFCLYVCWEIHFIPFKKRLCLSIVYVRKNTTKSFAYSLEPFQNIGYITLFFFLVQFKLLNMSERFFVCIFFDDIYNKPIDSNPVRQFLLVTLGPWYFVKLSQE